MVGEINIQTIGGCIQSDGVKFREAKKE